MSAMVFNAGIILLCSLPICQFAQTAFTAYSASTPNQCNQTELTLSNLWSADLKHVGYLLGV